MGTALHFLHTTETARRRTMMSDDQFPVHASTLPIHDIGKISQRGKTELDVNKFHLPDGTSSSHGSAVMVGCALNCMFFQNLGTCGTSIRQIVSRPVEGRQKCGGSNKARPGRTTPPLGGAPRGQRETPRCLCLPSDHPKAHCEIPRWHHRTRRFPPPRPCRA